MELNIHKYDIIFLIISSKNKNYYQEMKALTTLYMSKYSYNINFFFVEADPNIRPEMEIINNDIFIKCKELYSSIFIKTIKALKYINDNYNYDYLIRTNVSSFFNIQNMLKYLSNLPKEKFAIGFTLNIPIHCNFLHGTSIIITKDISYYLYKYYNKNYLKIADDVFISLILKSQNITLNVLDESQIQFLIDDNYDESKPKFLEHDNILYYRIKNNKDRNIDIIYFKFLLQKIYNVF
jgi:hypothetical protein